MRILLRALLHSACPAAGAHEHHGDARDDHHAAHDGTEPDGMLDWPPQLHRPELRDGFVGREEGNALPPDQQNADNDEKKSDDDNWFHG